MYRFRSIKYLATTGLSSALLFVIGYSSSWFFSLLFINFFGSHSTLQLFDGVFLALTVFFKGPMMLFVGPIAGSLLDLFAGIDLIIIPVTIVIRILMFCIIKILPTSKWWELLINFFIAILILIFGYTFFAFLIYQDHGVTIRELIINLVQGLIAYFLAIVLYFLIKKLDIFSKKIIWDDEQFDYLKAKKITNIK